MTGRAPGVENQPLLAWPLAAAILLRRRAGAELQLTPLYRWMLRGPPPTGVAVRPRDYRPANVEIGKQLLLGRLALGGEVMEIGQRGDPWDTASPSRRFAVALHRFDWLSALLALDPTQYPEAEEEALRLTLDFLTLFSSVSAFSWGAEVIERRVFHLACALPRVLPLASEVEQRRLMESLATQARHLLRIDPGALRAAERYACVMLAGAVLAGKAGQSLIAKAGPKLTRALKSAVLPDGGLHSRSPEQAMELLFDLLTLDDALHQRGVPGPAELNRAIDRLSGAVRFFTLSDGRLGAFQGGGNSTSDRVKAAVAHEDGSARVFGYAPHSGYHRLSSRQINTMIDAAPAATGPWSLAACAQPVAFEAVCGGDRLIVNTGWTPDTGATQALRLGDGGSTVSLGDASPGEPLGGLLAQGLGPRLVGGPTRIEARRNENEQGVWLELCHEGWVGRFGLTHDRRLYLDLKADELRGEDSFTPVDDRAERRTLTPYAIRFHLAPEVKVSLARDRRSVLLRGPSNQGWWFRNDAEEVALEPSVHYENGMGRRTLQIVLRGRVALTGGARIRWKLAPVDPVEHAASA